MKHDQINNIVGSHLKKLEQLSAEIRRSWKIADIHNFRVEAKKLRAFLRLLATGHDTLGKLPKRLHKFYRAIGEIRNLQLFRRQLTTLPTEKHYGLPDGFIAALDRRIAIKTQEVAHSMGKKRLFGKSAARLPGDLPLRLTHEQKRTFLLEKLQVIDHLRPSGDEALHDLRKAMKDLLYAWPYLAHDNGGNELPADPAAIRKSARLLGDYLDLTLALRMLHDPDTIAPVNGHGGLLLRAVAQEWQDRKEELRQQIADNYHVAC